MFTFEWGLKKKPTWKLNCRQKSLPRVRNKHLPLGVSLLERSFQLFFLCRTIANAIRQPSREDRRVFLRAGLLSGMSPQGAPFQGFPALPRTAVSLLFQQPRQDQRAAFPGGLTGGSGPPGLQPQVAAEPRPASPCALSAPLVIHVTPSSAVCVRPCMRLMLALRSSA